MIARYGINLAYRGSNYAGWQRQPNAISVEETLDTALSMMLGQAIKLVGCGRTDRGVHASDYVAHFDYAGLLPRQLVARLNRYLGDDIAVRGFFLLPPDTHARFSATGRSYVYRISTVKDPFRPATVSWIPVITDLDRGSMAELAALLPAYKEFAPFCKTKSDAYTMACTVTESRWVFEETEWTYHVSANRFLRGMVRLIVGACLRVGQGRATLEETMRALETQQPLPQPYSAPANGLYLSQVYYPERTTWQKIP